MPYKRCSVCETDIPQDTEFCPQCGWKCRYYGHERDERPQHNTLGILQFPKYVCKRCGESMSTLSAYWRHSCSGKQQSSAKQFNHSMPCTVFQSFNQLRNAGHAILFNDENDRYTYCENLPLSVITSLGGLRATTTQRPTGETFNLGDRFSSMTHQIYMSSL